MGLYRFPVGEVVIANSIAGHGIYKITGHLVSTYRGTNRPWDAIACEEIHGKTRVVDKDRYNELSTRLTIGTIPRREKFAFFVVDGMTRTVSPINTVKACYHGNNYAFFWGRSEWIMHLHDPGFSGSFMEPPEPSWDTVYSSMGHCDDLYDKEKIWLVDVAWYLRDYDEHRREERIKNRTKNV